MNENEFDDIIIPPPSQFADIVPLDNKYVPTLSYGQASIITNTLINQTDIRKQLNIPDYNTCTSAQKLYYYNVKKLKVIAKDKCIPNFNGLRRDELIDTLTKYYSLPLNLQPNYILELQNQYKLLNKIQSDKRKADKVDKKLKMWIN